MLTHLALMKPRADLSAADRHGLVSAFERAIREIPTVRGVRVGRRVVHGASYESRMPDTADYLVAIDFDDLSGLSTYLQHPAHEDLGARFGPALAAGLVYDFEGVSLGSLRDLK
jgi:Stress responsive A/B Barrel Domain